MVPVVRRSQCPLKDTANYSQICFTLPYIARFASLYLTHGDGDGRWLAPVSACPVAWCCRVCKRMGALGSAQQDSGSPKMTLGWCCAAQPCAQLQYTAPMSAQCTRWSATGAPPLQKGGHTKSWSSHGAHQMLGSAPPSRFDRSLSHRGHAGAACCPPRCPA